MTFTWWALHIKSKSCLDKYFETISGPKVNETPRSFSPQPSVSLSGSDQSRSQRSPWSGTSVGRMIRRICSMLTRSGERPGGKSEDNQLHNKSNHTELWAKWHKKWLTLATAIPELDIKRGNRKLVELTQQQRTPNTRHSGQIKLYTYAV